MMSGCETTLLDIDVVIEEEDVRIIPYSLHAVSCGATRVVLLSNGKFKFKFKEYFITLRTYLKHMTHMSWSWHCITGAC